MTSKHWTKDRQEREKLIETIGLGTEVATFTVDKGHRNGPELHTITTTGIIIVRNARTILTNGCRSCIIKRKERFR